MDKRRGVINAPNPDGPLHVGNVVCFELEAREAQGGHMDFDVRIDSSAHLVNRFDECVRSVLAASELLGRPISHLYDVRDIHPQCMETAMRLGAKGTKRDGTIVELDEFSWPWDEFPGKPSFRGGIYYVDIGGQDVYDLITPGAMPRHDVAVWHREARYKKSHPTTYHRGHVNEPMLPLIGAIDFMRHDCPFHARKVERTPRLAQNEIALMKLLGATTWPTYAHIPEIRDADGRVLNKSAGVAPEYEFSNFAQQWDTPQERRDALMRIIHIPDHPFEWRYVRKNWWVGIDPQGNVVKTG